MVSLIGSICCPVIIELSSAIKIHPLFFIGLLLISGSFFACLLPETLGKNMEDYVDEEKEEMKNPEIGRSAADVALSSANSQDSKRRFEKFNEEA
jgi:hypothetical protein